MKKFLLRTCYAVLGLVVLAGLVYHVGLRDWCLRWGTTQAEARGTLPGDDLFPAYASQATHAVTIHASPQKIWPWLMQIGQDRSGFYSYTVLENAFGCKMPKVEQLVPEWKLRAPGETVWFCDPKKFHGEGKMIPAIVDPERAFAMVTANDWQNLKAGKLAQESLWSFTLIPVADGQTRLIARVRGGIPPTLTSRLVGRLFWEPAHFVMEQKMLRTVRDLAERS
jgi:hypothetical protein